MGFNRVERGHCNRWFGRRGAEGFGPAAAKPAEAVSTAAHALPRRELVLDRYRPLRPLGSGGSGSVWLARDEQTGLDVALKIVPREGKAADRAEREAEAASRLRHERCLRAYGFGSDSGHVYIAYEYVGGRTLRDAMRAGELRDGQAIEAAAQILDGLAHAHSRGIVHRDVKPSNVLLADDEGISVRLLDFGLAQFDEAETLTAVGDVPGTLAYISPERLCGEEACAASDVWGVGILLWEALAGKHPFWGVPLLADGGHDRSGRAAAPGGAPGPAEAPARRDRPRARTRSGEAPTRRGAREGAARRPDRRRRVRRRSKVLFQHKPSSTAASPPPRPGSPQASERRCCRSTPRAARLRSRSCRRSPRSESPRAGLALALAAPVFPLGNVALGARARLRRRRARLARALLARCPLRARLSSPARCSRRSACSALVPVAVAGSRGAARRAAQALAAVAVAAVTAGVRGWDLPLRQGAVPPLDLDGTESVVTAATTLGRGGSRGPRPRGARAGRGRRRAPVRPHTVADRRISAPARWRRSSSPRRPRRRCRSSRRSGSPAPDSCSSPSIRLVRSGNVSRAA